MKSMILLQLEIVIIDSIPMRHMKLCSKFRLFLVLCCSLNLVQTLVVLVKNLVEVQQGQQDLEELL